MTPPPTLDELIRLVRQDTGGEGRLEQLATAAMTGQQLTETADAVIGYYVDQARAGGHTWTEISKVLGVTKQAVHKRFNGEADFSSYTDRARRALTAARQSADRLGHTYIGTEHLALGLLAESLADSVAGIILSEHGISAQDFETAVVQRVGRGGRSASEHVPFTPRARKLLSSGVPEIALELGHNYIGTEHILLAVTRFDGVAHDLLMDSGLNAEDARAAVIEYLSRSQRQ